MIEHKFKLSCTAIQAAIFAILFGILIVLAILGDLSRRFLVKPSQ